MKSSVYGFGRLDLNEALGRASGEAIGARSLSS